MPDLTGMTVPAAERALAKAGLSPEQGERLEPLERDGRRAEFAPRTGARVTSQSIERGRMIEAGGTVVVETGGRSGEDTSLTNVHWERIGFEHGRVVLRDVQRWGDCIEYDHAQLGPVKDGVRLISVWARNYGASTRPDCERNASARLHRGGDLRRGGRPAPAPPGTRFVHAPCGGAGQLRCG